VIAELAVAAALNPPHWTLAQARGFLVSHQLHLLDRAQPDTPAFDVHITSGAARSLVVYRNAFRFNGRAQDLLRGVSIRVRFTLWTGGRITSIHGPPPNRSQPLFPIRATFYYGWFPEAWDQEHLDPFTIFHPSLGFYDASSPAVLREQIAAMRYARISAAITSWWGPGSKTDARLPLALALARQTPFRWAVYYEPEGYGDPTAAQIHADLVNLRARYFEQPAYLRVGGRPVVFAYGDGGDNCSVAQRWHEADAGIGAYVVLSAFGGREHLSYEPLASASVDGVHVAAGDVDGDGKPELIAASGSVVRVFRRDGTDVAQFTVPETSVAAGDLDGDGRAEIVTGSETGGKVRAFDIAQGKAVERATFDTGLAGTRVAVGNGQIVVGATSGAPVVKVYSAAGAQLSSFVAASGTPISVAAGDGRIVTAARGEVRIFDAVGAESYPPFFPYGDYRGDLSVAIGDTNDDGNPEIVTDGDGVPVRIFSLLGQSATQFAQFAAFDPTFDGVASVATADTNGNGSAEVVAGAPRGHGGEVRLLYGFRDCADQPDGWHVYNPAQPEVYLPPYEFGISPGFARALVRPGDPSLPRDLSRWDADVADMNSSTLPWHLVETFNEWGEGTSVESAQEWATPSGYGAYLDALHAAPASRSSHARAAPR
jgi:hypothetical protein